MRWTPRQKPTVFWSCWVGVGLAHRVHIGVEEKYGECICPISRSIHHSFARDGRYSKGGMACMTHPHQAAIQAYSYEKQTNALVFILAMYLCTYDLHVPCTMFLMREDLLWGQVGRFLALEIKSFWTLWNGIERVLKNPLPLAQVMDLHVPIIITYRDL